MRIYQIFAALTLGSAVTLAGCASRTVYIRADGGPVSQQQIEADRAACDAESNNQFCMVQRGYLLVDKEQAAAKSAQLTAIADEDRRQAELAAAQAAKAKRKAQRRKKKPKQNTAAKKSSPAHVDTGGK